MKRILNLTTLLVLTVIFSIKAQETVNNFLLVDNETIWQKVYDTTLNFNQLTDNIKNSGLFENFEIGENKVMGNIKPIGADFKGAGYGEMVTPIYIARSFFDGFVIIDFKDGKYRVTLKKIVLTQKYNDTLTEQGEKSSIEPWSLKKGKNEFKDAFIKTPSKILDYTFSKRFDFSEKQNNENW
jgi:hypothetical protein